jgi:hypothetical protein
MNTTTVTHVPERVSPMSPVHTGRTQEHDEIVAQGLASSRALLARKGLAY